MSSNRESGGGGMTGATGDLTPDEPTNAFAPGERRDIEGADTPIDEEALPDDARSEEPDRATSRESHVGGDDLAHEPDRF